MNNLYIFGITSSRGGIELLMNNVIKDAIAKHLNTIVHIVTSYKDIAFEKTYINSGIEIIRIPDRKCRKKYKSALFNLMSKIKANDVLYLNVATYCNWALFKAAKVAKCKVIIHGHNAHVSNIFKKALHFIGKKRFAKIGYRIAVSEACNSFMFDSKADCIIYNGIDAKKFFFNSENRRLVRKELNISHDKIVVGSLGRISKEKNQIYLIKKTKEWQNYLFVFIGGFMDKKYEAKIIKNAYSNCIFLGEKEDVAKYLSSLDAMVIPSKHEGFPLSAVESLTNGLPVFYIKKLYKHLSPPIRDNDRSCIFNTNYFCDAFLAKFNNDRNRGDVEMCDKYDLSFFLNKIANILYE